MKTEKEIWRARVQAFDNVIMLVVLGILLVMTMLMLRGVEHIGARETHQEQK